MDIRLQDLRTILADVLDIEEEEITKDAHFIDDLGVGSLASLEVLVKLEQVYGIKIPESELDKLISLDAINQLIQERIK